MRKKRVAINGFGRIGRLTFRRLLLDDNIEVVAINDLATADILAHLLKYDSNQGKFNADIDFTSDEINVNGVSFRLFNEKDPASLPWDSLEIDIVAECSGKFTDREGSQKHIKAGAKKVVLSAPGKSPDIKTIVIGVNEEELKEDDIIISNASCTTNCLAPMAKVLDDYFGIDRGYINTIHAYTADQRLQDAPHKDPRRARAAAVSVIPTSTGAAKAVGLVLPHLKGKLDGMATRVPVVTGSMTDLTVILKKEVSADEINSAFKSEAEGKMKNILEYTSDPIVSADIIGNPHSCIFDSGLTSANGNLVKVVGWYDNEFGYASRTAELIGLLSIN